MRNTALNNQTLHFQKTKSGQVWSTINIDTFIHTFFYSPFTKLRCQIRWATDTNCNDKSSSHASACKIKIILKRSWKFLLRADRKTWQLGWSYLGLQEPTQTVAWTVFFFFFLSFHVNFIGHIQFLTISIWP